MQIDNELLHSIFMCVASLMCTILVFFIKGAVAKIVALDDQVREVQKKVAVLAVRIKAVEKCSMRNDDE